MEGTEELKKFSMKNLLTLPSSANKYFNSLRDENHEPIYIYIYIFLQLPIKEKVKNIEVKRMRSGYVFDTLTSIDICEILKWVEK